MFLRIACCSLHRFTVRQNDPIKSESELATAIAKCYFI